MNQPRFQKWMSAVDPELLEEAKTLNFLSPRSSEMEKTIKEIWAMAKEQEPWFKYGL